MEIPRLETERTLLTLPPPSAAPRVLAYFERNRARLEPLSPPWPAGFFTVEHHAERLANARSELVEDKSLRLWVFRANEEDGDAIGSINFNQFFRLAFQRCILGYSVDGAHEGRGLLREALEASIRYVFATLKFHRIEANYIPTNERSGRLLRRLGFTVEGYARDYLFLGGAWRDHVLTSLTNASMSAP